MLLALPILAGAQAPASVDLDPYLRKDLFSDITISPTGEYFAATVPLEDRTGLVVLRRSDMKITARVSMGKDSHILSVAWVSDKRMLMSLAETFGAEDKPTATGELFGMDADGEGKKLLVGWRANSDTVGTRLNRNNEQSVVATLIDALPGDDNNVLISVSPYHDDPVTRVERMDVRSGRRLPVTRVTARRAEFITDNAQRVRFAVGLDSGNASLLFHRADDSAEWVLVNDENKTRRVEVPIGFAPDNRIAYLASEQSRGPDQLVAYDTVSGERKPVLRHDVVDPSGYLWNLGAGVIPVGARYDTGPVPTTQYIDPDSADARVHRMLEMAFPGQSTVVTSTTRDGKLALVWAGGATNPGDYYLFDVANRKAEHLLSRAEWFAPEAMGEVRAVQLKSRDGRTLHGVLTLPPGSAGRGLPMVVNPHGGPIGIRDDFSFNSEAQMLAEAGYAVLQVNFRGSGGYGREFLQAGAREWGGKMQDDLTDATKWAVAEGIAASDRICIYGASYGGYASLMGAVREPALYRCAVGYIGVYDLDKVVRDSASGSRLGRVFSTDWIGNKGELAASSPNRLADRIKIPVFLAAGGEDTVAPVEHTRMMESALRKAGVPVESLYFKNESHGFYKEEHRREYYTKLLDFLARHLGGARAAPAKPAKK